MIMPKAFTERERAEIAKQAVDQISAQLSDNKIISNEY